MKRIFNIAKTVLVWLISIIAVSVMLFTIISVTTFNRNDRNLFGYKKHEFTGVDYIEYYHKVGGNCQVILANNPCEILKYTKYYALFQAILVQLHKLTLISY